MKASDAAVNITPNPNEKLFPWTENSMRWYRAAETYGRNNRCKVLADMILSELSPDPSVIDMGCGLGHLSLELAKSSKRVLSIDLSRYAIESLESEAERLGVKNIKAVQADFELMEPIAGYDAMVLCLFGGSSQFIKKAVSWVSGKIFLVVNASRDRAFGVNGAAQKPYDVDEIQEYLGSEGYSYKCMTAAVDFGQPFTDLDDARGFMAHYNQKATQQEIDDMLDKKLVATGETDYPFYMPSVKNYAFFVIDKM